MRSIPENSLGVTWWYRKNWFADEKLTEVQIFLRLLAWKIFYFLNVRINVIYFSVLILFEPEATAKLSKDIRTTNWKHQFKQWRIKEFELKNYYFSRRNENISKKKNKENYISPYKFGEKEEKRGKGILCKRELWSDKNSKIPFNSAQK